MGLAVCDALGAQIEGGKSREEPPYEMVGGGWHDVIPGGWTDDTAMTLCLAESLIETQKFDLNDQLKRYVQWRQHGHLSWSKFALGMGGTTRDAIDDYERNGETIRKNQDPGTCSGNGSIMRLAPVALAYCGLDTLALYAGQSSQTTHNTPETIDTCIFLAKIIEGCLQGSDKQKVLHDIPEKIQTLRGGVEGLRRGDWENKNIHDLKTTSYVITTLETALWVFAKAPDFERGAKSILSFGGDADTIGAVYGQIAGAYYGLEQIPARWRQPIAMKETILNFADRLYTFNQSTSLS